MGALCRPCLLPDGANPESLFPEWVLGLVEDIHDGDPLIGNVANLFLGDMSWKGDGAKLLQAVIQMRGLSACARVLGKSTYGLRRELSGGRVPLTTVLAINSTLGERL